MQTISVAQARNQLTEHLRQVEEGQPLAVTRRGLPVVVWVAAAEYERLRSAAGHSADFALWAQAWRQRLPAGIEGISSEDLRRWSEPS